MTLAPQHTKNKRIKTNESVITTVSRDNAPKPVQRRLLITLVSVLLLLIGGFVTILLYIQQDQLEHSSQEKVKAVSYELTGCLEMQTHMLSALEEVLLREPDLIDALRAQDRNRLLSDYDSLFADLRAKHSITHFYFQRPDRINLLRMHKPDKSGDLINRFTTLEAERTGKMVSGIELGPLGTFTIRVVQPVFDGQNLIGYLELGMEIEDLLKHITEEHNIELAITIHKTALVREQWEAGMKMLERDADWTHFADDVIIYSSLPETVPLIDKAHNEGAGEAPEVEFNGKSWKIMLHPLADVSGAEVGNLVIMRDISGEKSAFNRVLFSTVGVVFVLLAVLLCFLFITLRRTDYGIQMQQAELVDGKERFDQLAEQSNTIAWEVDLRNST